MRVNYVQIPASTNFHAPYLRAANGDLFPGLPFIIGVRVPMEVFSIQKISIKWGAGPLN
jgi:hypothetical protein